MKKIAFILLLPVLFAQCGPNKTEAPEYKIELSESADHFYRHYTITEDEITVEYKNENNSISTRTIGVELEDAVKIEKALSDTNFLKLKKEYDNTSAADDVMRFDFKIANGGLKKNIAVCGVRIKEIFNLVKKINSILPEGFDIGYNEEYFNWQMANVTCTLTADKHIYTAGEQPKIGVRIKNNTDTVIMLLNASQNSRNSFCLPQAYFSIQREDFPPITDQLQSTDFNGVHVNDFVEVRQGEFFDPFKAESSAFTGYSLDTQLFEKSGTYTITFFYSTDERNFNRWLGNNPQSNNWLDPATGNVLPSKKAGYDQLFLLFKKVPKVLLMSNAITIQVM